jgi:hypothetical protein
MMKRIIAIFAALLALAGPAMALDCSGTIANGGTAQTIYTSGNVRNVMLINNSANMMCFSITGTAATIAGTNCGAGSYPLQPGSSTAAGGSFTNPAGVNVPTVSIISSGTGDRYSCERQ